MTDMTDKIRLQKQDEKLKAYNALALEVSNDLQIALKDYTEEWAEASMQPMMKFKAVRSEKNQIEVKDSLKDLTKRRNRLDKKRKEVTGIFNKINKAVKGDADTVIADFDKIIDQGKAVLLDYEEYKREQERIEREKVRAEEKREHDAMMNRQRIIQDLRSELHQKKGKYLMTLLTINNMDEFSSTVFNSPAVSIEAPTDQGLTTDDLDTIHGEEEKIQVFLRDSRREILDILKAGADKETLSAKREEIFSSAGMQDQVLRQQELKRQAEERERKAQFELENQARLQEIEDRKKLALSSKITEYEVIDFAMIPAGIAKVTIDKNKAKAWLKENDAASIPGLELTFENSVILR